MGNVIDREVDTVTIRFHDNDQITFRLHGDGRIGADFIPVDYEAVYMLEGLKRILLALEEQLWFGKCKFDKDAI